MLTLRPPTTEDSVEQDLAFGLPSDPARTRQLVEVIHYGFGYERH